MISFFPRPHFLIFAVPPLSFASQGTIDSEFTAGNYYINMHTTALPNGAAWGDLKVDSSNEWYALLKASDASQSPAWGLGMLSWDSSNDMVSWVVFENLSSSDPPTMMHIHRRSDSSVAVNTQAVSPINTMRNPNTGTDSPGTLTTAGLDAGDAFYFNIHSEDYPAGAIESDIFPLGAVVFPSNEEEGNGDDDGSDAAPTVLLSCMAAAASVLALVL